MADSCECHNLAYEALRLLSAPGIAVGGAAKSCYAVQGRSYAEADHVARFTESIHLSRSKN